jgi:hypothetical protein
MLDMCQIISDKIIFNYKNKNKRVTGQSTNSADLTCTSHNFNGLTHTNKNTNRSEIIGLKTPHEIQIKRVSPKSLAHTPNSTYN